MESKPRETAVMTILVDDHLVCHTNYKGNPGLLLPMLGGLEFARDWCVGQLKAREQPLCIDEKSKQNLLVTVSRGEALNLYYSAFATLRERLNTIEKSAPQATFQIPSFLPHL